MNAATLAEFNQRGFPYIVDICSQAELAVLRAALPTIVGPSNYAPELRDLQCRQRAAAIGVAVGEKCPAASSAGSSILPVT